MNWKPPKFPCRMCSNTMETFCVGQSFDGADTRPLEFVIMMDGLQITMQPHTHQLFWCGEMIPPHMVAQKLGRWCKLTDKGNWWIRMHLAEGLQRSGVAHQGISLYDIEAQIRKYVSEHPHEPWAKVW